MNNPPTPPPPDRAQSNESVPQLPPDVHFVNEAEKCLGYALAFPRNVAIGLIESVIAQSVAPPVSQRATGEDRLTAGKIYHRRAVLDCAGEIARWATSLVAKTVEKYGDTLVGIPKGTEAVRDDLRVMIGKYFPEPPAPDATPRSLPHGVARAWSTMRRAEETQSSAWPAVDGSKGA